jgi:hypothetical protein
MRSPATIQPTFKDVARLARVSDATASYILNNSEHAARISDKTRDAIFRAAARLHFQPDPVPRALSDLWVETQILRNLGQWFPQEAGSMNNAPNANLCLEDDPDLAKA